MLGCRQNASNSFAVKILTSKSLRLNILQTILAEPAPVGAFRRGRGGGTPKAVIFPGVKRAQTVT
jgi:hypothetical protein